MQYGSQLVRARKAGGIAGDPASARSRRAFSLSGGRPPTSQDRYMHCRGLSEASNSTAQWTWGTCARHYDSRVGSCLA
jgi:hypothetical protein